jgi:hypothetical protein
MKGTILTGLSTGCGKGRFSVKNFIYNETKKDSFFVSSSESLDGMKQNLNQSILLLENF